MKAARWEASLLNNAVRKRDGDSSYWFYDASFSAAPFVHRWGFMLLKIGQL